MISACAVGSLPVRFRFQPWAMTRPSQITTAPTGTSPASIARCAARRASAMKSSSEEESLVAGRWSSGTRGSPSLALYREVPIDSWQGGVLSLWTWLTRADQSQQLQDRPYARGQQVRKVQADHGHNPVSQQHSGNGRRNPADFRSGC